MEPNPNNSPQSPDQDKPEGFHNWPKYRQEEYTKGVVVGNEENNTEESELDVYKNTFASETHPDRNEDSVFSLTDEGLFGILDGVSGRGGHSGGEVASKIGAESFQKNLTGLSSNLTIDELKKKIEEAFNIANQEILDKKSSDPSLKEMATTATVVKIWEGDNEDRKVIVGNVGDSRAYILNIDGTFKQITLDHSQANMVMSLQHKKEEDIRNFQSKINNLTDPGELTPEENNFYQMRNVITRALGTNNHAPDIYLSDLKNVDSVIITSDGIHDNLTDDEIAQILRDIKNDDPAKSLIGTALARSREDKKTSIRAKPDDMSAIVVKIYPTATSNKEQDPSDPNFVKNMMDQYDQAINGKNNGETKTEPSPEVAAEPPPIVKQEKTFEEEWKEFENLRDDLAKTEALKLDYSSFDGTSIEDLRAKYETKKYALAEKIKSDVKNKEEGSLLFDKENQLDKYATTVKVNDALIDFLRKERKDYAEGVKKFTPENFLGGTKELLRKTLGSKVVQGYMALSKKQRIAFNLALGSTVGLLAGAAVAPGMAGAASYLTWRTIRGLSSAGAGIKAGEWANKKWSLEELEAKEREEIEALKNSQLSVGEKSKRLDEIENRYKKQKSWLNFKKIGTTVAAGAGAGLLTGLLEQASVSLGRGPKMVIEPPSKGSGSIDNRLPGRQGFGQTNLKVAQNEVVIEKPVAPKPESAMPEPVAPKAEVTNDSQPTETEAAKTVETPIVPPEVMTHEVKSGDSVWKLLEKTLDNNEKFKVMSEAQKTYVLSNLTGKMLGSPATYGFKPGGGVEIGYKLDFTEALDDNKEVESLFEKAKQTIGEGSKQEDLIVENNEKILEFLEDHPNEPLNEEAVAKILNTRPKVEFTPIKTDSLLVIERDIAELVKSNNLPPESVEKLIKIGEEGKVLRARILEFEKTDQSAPDFNRNNFLAEKLKLEEEMTKIEGRMADIIEENKKPNTPYESGEVKTALQNEVNNDIANEIAKARKGFPVPESSPRPTGLRSMSGDVVNLNSNVDAAFREEIDSIYGKGGVLGFFGKTAGVDTKEWGEIRGLSAKDVIQYYEDPEHSRLPAKIIKSLATSDKHRRLMEQIAGIQEQIFDTVKFNGENIKIEPRDNGESVENFIKRLGAFLMKQPNK